MALSVVQIGEDDIARLREIRLEALRSHPEAFSADPDVWETFTTERWRALLKSSDWFAAVDGGDWMGIAAFSREGNSKKTEHLGSLGAMYVRAKYRGKGVGDALISAILEHAAQRIEQIKLTVNADNKPAIALYERHGFRAYGRTPRALKIAGRYYDEIEMARPVSASD